MTDAFGHGPPRDGTRERTLERLWVDFVKLQRLRAEIISDFHTSDPEPATPELTDEVFASITGELNRLASRAAGIASTGSDEMEYKAVMLAEFLPANDSAIHVVLARSLVSDIKNGPYPN